MKSVSSVLYDLDESLEVVQLTAELLASRVEQIAVGNSIYQRINHLIINTDSAMPLESISKTISKKFHFIVYRLANTCFMHTILRV